MRDPLLLVLFVFIWAIALTNAVAEYYYLYWIYRWFDIPMHFFGGVWVGLAMLWVVFHSGYFRAAAARYHPLFVAVVGGLCIGFIWEVYEFAVWQLSGKWLPDNYVPDSLLDLVMDALGTFAAYGMYRWTPLGRAAKEGDADSKKRPE